MPLNAQIGWILILLGFLSGGLLGLGFHKPDWLGGYGSLTRRMLRLGHIALVALGLLNVIFAQTVVQFGDVRVFGWASWLWIAGAIAMPICCGLMAWRSAFRGLFAVPVLCLTGACALTCIGVCAS